MRRACLLLVSLSAVPALATAQGRFPPDSLVNVRVLPRTTPVPQVISMMRGFTFALGVRCTYCHVGEEGRPLDSYDFASDDRRNKLVAREMLRMVQTINEQTMANLPERPTPGVQVRCATCHRGVTRPFPLTDLLVQAVGAGGADSAVRAYRALRREYYGRDAYDFDERTLNDAAATLVSAGRRFDAALALLALNEEFNPGRASVMFTRGEVFRVRGDTAAAVAAYRSALERDPQDFGARRRLADLGQRP